MKNDPGTKKIIGAVNSFNLVFLIKKYNKTMKLLVSEIVSFSEICVICGPLPLYLFH